MKKPNWLSIILLLLMGAGRVILAEDDVQVTMLENGSNRTIEKLTIHYRPEKQTHFVYQGPSQVIENFKPGDRIKITHKKGDHVLAIVTLHDKKPTEDIHHFSHYSNHHWHFRDHYTLREWLEQQVKIMVLKEDKHGKRYLEALR